ncbi:hypothetical protein F3Y22_tig00110556pilonHSYRG00322 [Hibiscus syriacus]|uniref:Uncharacterized protein n=1 Tax=Hibiscus syriacus TaxID=106335 RepID=A0A6A3ACH7_HIBSY|nr:hypothetical protein F3Y22_tig00110556pilonHSYRG00322 [Hibiscus syriacus]
MDLNTIYLVSPFFPAEDGSSSIAANMRQLELHDDDQEPPHEVDGPSVIIPNHLQLQVHSQDCSYLSFGPDIGSTFYGSFASRPLKNNLDEVPEAADISSIGHTENRNPVYYGDEQIASNTDGNIMIRSNVSTGNYEANEDSEPAVLKQDASEAAQGSQYTFPSSASGYNYENSFQLNHAFTHPETNTQIQNLTPFSSVMQAYTNSLPSTLLTSTVQTAREPDLPYSPFPVTQSILTKYTNAFSSISGPTFYARGNSTDPAWCQRFTGTALPQHLAMHPFPQPAHPLGHFANMISYPFLTQSYTYMPSAFQQAFAGKYLPQSAAIASGYGFGNSTNVPGGLPPNPPTAPAGTTIAYDDILSSQYKDSNHLMSLQQCTDHCSFESNSFPSLLWNVCVHNIAFILVKWYRSIDEKSVLPLSTFTHGCIWFYVLV